MWDLGLSIKIELTKRGLLVAVATKHSPDIDGAAIRRGSFKFCHCCPHKPSASLPALESVCCPGFSFLVGTCPQSSNLSDLGIRIIPCVYSKQWKDSEGITIGLLWLHHNALEEISDPNSYKVDRSQRVIGRKEVLVPNERTLVFLCGTVATLIDVCSCASVKLSRCCRS